MALTCTSSSTLFFPSPSPNPNPPLQQHPHLFLLLRPTVAPPLRRRSPRASSSSPRRPPNFPPDAVVVVSDPRAWREIRAVNEEEYGSDEDDEDDGEEDDDRSLDLLVRFLHNVFRKVSRRVRRAVRSVLPVPISAKLVRFSVDGVLILAFLWILKAFLEVVCTLGSMVFVSILLVRGIWSGVSYLQEIRYDRSRFDNDDSIWSGVQAAT